MSALGFTDQEVRDLKTVFAVFDASGGGVISQEDARKALKVPINGCTVARYRSLYAGPATINDSCIVDRAGIAVLRYKWIIIHD